MPSATPAPPKNVTNRAPAKYSGTWEPGTLLTTVLTSGAGDTLTVLSMSLDGPPIRTISATQSFFFGVGAVINVAADQPEGVYTSTFDVQANYL